jgi:hypothetical protein
MSDIEVDTDVAEQNDHKVRIPIFLDQGLVRV